MAALWDGSWQAFSQSHPYWLIPLLVLVPVLLLPPCPQVPYPGALLGVAIHWAVNHHLPSPQERDTLDQKE